MKTKKLCPILMIKTSGIERNRGIFFKDSLQDGKLVRNHYDPNIEFSDCLYFHLYVVSDDVIRPGDWCVLLDDFGNLFAGPQKYQDPETQHINRGLRKVIATTDPHLNLRSLDQELIEDFLIRYNDWNPIEEVEVTYIDFELPGKPLRRKCVPLPKGNSIEIVVPKLEVDLLKIRPILLKLVHSVVDEMERTGSTGFDLDRWIETQKSK